ncbi:sensor domain-containing diguanylate cyclase (plasmid) [Ralstonia sp. 25C]|uniref:sensor domain-containing diguanylate cyclase n=1 Tax=Ralstonia sp. 25C TaxID=3447363 RepID=UPI003F755254
MTDGNKINPLRWLSGQWDYRRLTAPRAIVIAGAAVALLMVSICATVLYQSRLDAMAHASATSRSLALLAERDIERNFELYALSLQAVVDRVNDPEVAAASPRLRGFALFDHAATATYLGSMLVLDAQGNIVIDAANDLPRQGNFSDREYFKVHRDNPNAGLYVGAPYASRLRGGALSIPLSRRLSHPDGSFAGVVLIAVQLDYFRKLFAALSLGPHGSVALIGRDGAMIMRQPYDEKVIGRNIRNASTFKRFLQAPEGSFSDTLTIDGIERQYYFKNLPNLPLIIMVAQAHSDIYAAWRHRAFVIASVMGALAVGFVGLSVAFGVQLKRRMRAESELALLARTDGLTGLNNRRTLGEILDQEWRRAKRNHSVLSLLFVDIDWFKLFNDTYGHQAGDDALAAVAKCIGENIRQPGDSAARYGGEEFVIVLPDTPPEGAVSMAEKIRAAISDLGIEHALSRYGRVTASIGTAAWTPDADVDVSAVIRAADQALYDAKAAGRNMVAQSEPHLV